MSGITTIEQARVFAAEGYKTVPLYAKLPARGKTPAEVFRTLKALSKHCFILESADRAGQSGRYTFLGFDPKLEISCKDGKLTIKNGAVIEVETSDPASYISKIIDDNKGPRIDALPPYTGGLVGYFSFEYIRYAEPKLPKTSDAGESFKDADLMLFDKAIVFDAETDEIILIANIRVDSLEENFARGELVLSELEGIVKNGKPAELPPLRLKTGFLPRFGREGFCEIVEKAKRYIREGDIFQVVLSNRYAASAEGSLFGAYEIMRRKNPSPYMFYFSSDDVEIAGAAPETLVKLRGDVVTTFPLAGTRPRGETPEEDAAIEADLLSDEKELAEHNMLVDLGRNDIGKVAKFGSVKVENYLSIERFSHVMHIGSTVTGRLKREKTAVDALGAVLPAGTLSGAPKFRAAEIINELEGGTRGIYGGAIGYLALCGDMDTCIAIRIAFKKNGKVFIRSGAGIVADSVPETEYTECENKLAAVRLSLEEAAGKETAERGNAAKNAVTAEDKGCVL